MSLSFYFATHAPGNTWLTDRQPSWNHRDIMLQIKKTLKKAENRHEDTLDIVITTELMTSSCLCPGRSLGSQLCRQYCVMC